MLGAPCLCAHLVGHFLPGGETQSPAVHVVAAEDWPGQVGTQPPERTPRKKGEALGRLHRYTPREIPGVCTERKQQEPGGQSRLDVPRLAHGKVLVVRESEDPNSLSGTIRKNKGSEEDG